MDKSPMFVRSADTEALVAHGRTIAVGDSWTYDAMHSTLGRSATYDGPAHGSLQSARRILESEGIFFGVVRGVGLKRLAPVEVLDSTTDTRKKIARATRRCDRKLQRMDYDALEPSEKMRHNVARSLMMMTEWAMSGRTVTKMIDGLPSDARGPLPLAKTLAFFSESSKGQ